MTGINEPKATLDRHRAFNADRTFAIEGKDNSVFEKARKFVKSSGERVFLETHYVIEPNDA